MPFSISHRNFPFTRANSRNNHHHQPQHQHQQDHIMFKFGASKLGTLIASFDDYKLMSKKYSQTQSKAFDNMHEWSLDTNNVAIQVSLCFGALLWTTRFYCFFFLFNSICSK